MDIHAEVMKLQAAVTDLDRPMGKIIAAASDEYYACLGGMRRAQLSGNRRLFARWASLMHRLIPEIAENPPARYLNELVKTTR